MGNAKERVQKLSEQIEQLSIEREEALFEAKKEELYELEKEYKNLEVEVRELDIKCSEMEKILKEKSGEFLSKRDYKKTLQNKIEQTKKEIEAMSPKNTGFENSAKINEEQKDINKETIGKDESLTEENEYHFKEEELVEENIDQSGSGEEQAKQDGISAEKDLIVEII